jgi:hypothetical protein
VAGETVLGGPYHITATLSPSSVLSNYTITNTGAAFTISTRSATWTTNPSSKTYGDADPSPLTTGSGSNFVAADGVTATYTRAAGETVLGGPYHITATLSPSAVLSNYTITNTGAAFTINKAKLTVTADPQSVQYSDPVTFTATIGGFKNNENLATSGVTGSPRFTTTATLSQPANLPAGSNGTVQSGPAPVPYTITPALGSLAASNYSFSFVPGKLTVTQEDAVSYYTGLNFSNTASTSNYSVTVTLSATIKDTTAVTANNPYYDAYPGNIANATVDFVFVNASSVTGSPGYDLSKAVNLVVQPVSGTNNEVGTVTGTATLTIPSNNFGATFTLGIRVKNYYTNINSQNIEDSTNPVDYNFYYDVALPVATGFITGGDHLKATSSGGLVPADAGSNINDGFNVHFSNGGSNPKGNLSAMIRSHYGMDSTGAIFYDAANVHNWQIKTNAVTSLSTSTNSSGAPIASFQAKATFTDLTTGYGDGNASLTATMTDNGSPGVNKDTIGLTLYRKDGALYFSSNWWNNTKTVEQAIAGGEIVVHSAQHIVAGAIPAADTVPVLTTAQLQPVLTAAISQWAAAGLDASDLAKLRNAPVQIGSHMGQDAAWTSVDGTIYLTPDAAGYGWWVDPTQSPAANRVDLLTVVSHELGHILGIGEDDSVAGDLMNANLSLGVRRTPSTHDLADFGLQPYFAPITLASSIPSSGAGTLAPTGAASPSLVPVSGPVAVLDGSIRNGRASGQSPSQAMPAAIARSIPTIAAASNLVPSVALDGSILHDLALDSMTPTGLPLRRRAKK